MFTFGSLPAFYRGMQEQELTDHEDHVKKVKENIVKKLLKENQNLVLILNNC